MQMEQKEMLSSQSFPKRDLFAYLKRCHRKVRLSISLHLFLTETLTFAILTGLGTTSTTGGATRNKKGGSDDNKRSKECDPLLLETSTK